VGGDRAGTIRTRNRDALDYERTADRAREDIGVLQ
jgi:hypothetical protein